MISADINNRTRGSYTNFQGGIHAVYAYERNYKVEAVTAITPLRKISSDDKNHQSKQNPSQAFTKTFFSEVLDEACEKEQTRNIHIKTTGYTKDALLHHTFINMREYR